MLERIEYVRHKHPDGNESDNESYCFEHRAAEGGFIIRLADKPSVGSLPTPLPRKSHGSRSLRAVHDASTSIGSFSAAREKGHRHDSFLGGTLTSFEVPSIHVNDLDVFIITYLLKYASLMRARFLVH